jgi:tetratricopeptide (TPR) repeat protein
MPEQRKLEGAALCYCLLALITLAVFLPVVEARFVAFDDTFYLTDNPKVQAGLTWESVRWAFTHCHAANWHPLSWLSHMLDCQLYGLRPAGHHLTSLLFHTANTLLLFGLLKYLTGAFWRSAFVAALFALHPLHVESVAWVSERKDVLSTFFFLLTLWAYARYAGVSRVQSLESGECPPSAAPHAPRVSRHASLFYLLALCLFAMGLMSKPMLVTVPFVLLLLDYWPLGRLQLPIVNRQPPQLQRVSSVWRLVAEKLPFLVLSAASCVVTVIAQRKGGALASLEGGAAVSVESRLINTPVSYAWYLAKLVWPSNLAVVYPYLREWPPETVLLSTMLVVALTGVAVWQARRRAYVLVGWLWYLGSLVPVIGLVKVGVQSIADRYMYIPCIGLFIVLAWGVADLTAGWAQRTIPLAAGAAAVLAACALAAGAQLRYWQDTESLFRHALAVTQNNYLAFNNLGLYFAEHGQWELAKKYYRAALQIAPNYEAARNNLAAALVNDKNYPEGIAMLEEALHINPHSADIESNLGAALYSEGNTLEAIEHLRRAIQLNPEYALAHYNLGNALLKRDQAAEAAAEFRLAAKLKPRYAEAHNNLALVLASQEKLDEAVAEFGQALALQPTLLPAHYGLGMVLFEQGRLDEAIAQFSEVLRRQPNHQPAWLQLGLARARQGKLADAAEAFSAALRILPDDAEVHCHLAAALVSQHKAREAVPHYRAALKLAPDSPEALNNLAWVLAANPDPQVRNGQEAVDLAQRACKLTGYKRPLMVGTLAAAYAEAGRFTEAMATAEKARTLAEQSDQLALAARNRELLELYRSGKPVRDTP